MMMDLTSSVVDGTLVLLGVVGVLIGGIQTILSDATTMSTASELDAPTKPSPQTTPLRRAA